MCHHWVNCRVVAQTVLEQETPGPGAQGDSHGFLNNVAKSWQDTFSGLFADLKVLWFGV